ncbi:pyridoxamine 5'-phosphate oxidase family protein [Microbacterium enclense]|uniref:Pyridoxamine 5'-phosphate oxidase family protein n=1 Tax=Microbacterium enclense TaxID=993073 RepID=A0A3S3L7A7_9MICO|nr:pyridoxamine 5'-phosphate oxidase family protein [Microbacterium enclense]RWR17758.1 pyridoxamine 5'-phosphate oxidase family protein [Microbacterium enclense]
MTHDQSPTPPVVELGTAESWRLLESERLGRLALVDASGEPRIYPVNFATRDGALYVRSADDAKLRFLRSRPTVAFEIDGEDAGDRWSVVVLGNAAPVEMDAEIRHGRETALRSMSPTSKPYIVRISPRSVTGRRFTERGEDSREDPLRSRIFRPREIPLPAAARPPHPIAGIAPRANA